MAKKSVQSKPTWTWADVPAEWRPPQYRGSTIQRHPEQVVAHARSIGVGEPGADAPREPDALMRELCALMTPTDAGVIVATKAACAATIDRWRNGLCFNPQIGTLRRVANVMGKDIGLVDRRPAFVVHEGGKAGKRSA